MKKLFTITMSAAMLIAAAATAFVSCKKQQQNFGLNTQQGVVQTEAGMVYEKIVKFREAREAYHANTRTDNGYVSTSEARSILDASINYEFSDINRYLEDTELDTLRYTAPATDAEGNVAVNDLVNIYDKFVSDISDDTNSVNCFMIVYPQNDNSSSDVEVVFTRGTNAPPTPPTPPEPYYFLDYFEEDDNWIWAYDNGKCDVGGYSDAAQELTKKCRAMLTPSRTQNRNDDADTLDLNIGFMYDIEYITKKSGDLQGNINGLDYWLFHAENVPADDVSTYCITYDYMNLYLKSLYVNIILSAGCFHYSPVHNSPIRDVEIDKGETTGRIVNIWHLANMTYYKIGCVQ